MVLEELLIEKGIIDREQLKNIQLMNRLQGENLLQVLVRSGIVSEDKLLRAICDFLGLVYIELGESPNIDPEAIKAVPAKYVVPTKLLPIKWDQDVLVIATSDPFNFKTIDELNVLIGHTIRTVISNSHDIDRLLKKYYGIGAESMDQLLAESGQKLEVLQEGGEEAGESLEMVEDASLIQFVNQIILEAVRDRASDIHFEPFENDLIIRYRIDGMLFPAVTPPKMKLFQQAIISRIKIMAELNIAEKRLPQDGRIKLRVGDREIDVRVSIIPGIHGEGIVLRLLDRSSILLGLEDIGMDEDIYKAFKKIIVRPHGIFLVTGPTGSGKSTTLYAALQEINSTEKKIITIEDPVEYQIDRVFQIPTKPKIGFDFAQGLRSILRHDPDVIMVGEIRDRETADIAIRSALTGHMVFSTIHTNDAAGGLTRLVDMGIEPYLVSSSVEGLMAQRLVRKICPDCREEEKTPPKEYAVFAEKKGFHKTFRGKGCSSCRKTGYKGRIGIFELLLMDDPIREMVMNRQSAGIIKDYAIKNGVRNLYDDGLEKVVRGYTTIEEVLRVTKED